MILFLKNKYFFNSQNIRKSVIKQCKIIFSFQIEKGLEVSTISVRETKKYSNLSGNRELMLGATIFKKKSFCQKCVIKCQRMSKDHNS